jgi:phosphoenolpyruvate carboxykinase (GTP)
MKGQYLKLLKAKCSKASYGKLIALNNLQLWNFVAKYAELCRPSSIYICDDSYADAQYIRKKAKKNTEETELAIKGHTVHFDGYNDQARDRKNTKYLLSEKTRGIYYLNSTERKRGLKEIKALLRKTMAGKEMFVRFFCLGPVDSAFSILAVQITDSSYVAHSEDILYRPGYGEFRKNSSAQNFFKFVHSAGKLEEGVSKSVEKRRIYIDLEENLVYSVNTQYAGNTVGLKKLALRLAIKKASCEGWLAEHMFIMSISDRSGKKAYFCGAYPSMCGKTSTAMLPGETVVGDDIAYLRISNGNLYAANVERGIFGIIKGVNSKDDPIIFNALTREGEVIFSNVLIDAKKVPFWTGKSTNVPAAGINFSGQWFPGKTDRAGNEIALSHKNARYTIRLQDLKNVDENLENPQGVKVDGIIYGGRDSDTCTPIEQAFDWKHGIITKAASLESETTAATLGQEGTRVFNPMSNIDFLSILLGKYIKMNLDVEEKLQTAPLIFSVNYFLRDEQGKFLNQMQDKLIWLKWMRLRVGKKVAALSMPTGLIPKYEDLKDLFREFLKKEYTKDDYAQQFKLRIPENLAKIARIRNIYKKLREIPSCLFEELEKQEKRLQDFREQFGDYVSPEKFTTPTP